ncbi:hypothetical protein BD414DRAFT_508316 [Trametes punicea]|nr:hypothetical protein BD414DRAFT_508316 [Trametes punicea]
MDPTEHHSTPVSAGRIHTQHGVEVPGFVSLAAEHQSLGQYRAASAEDMAHKAVRLEPEEFLNHFFKSPSPADAHKPPAWDFNVFEGVADAKNMKEGTIAQIFVDAVNKYNLAPGLKMAQSEHKPDEGDSTAQKIDAAFFRADAVPSDGRPHWADQIVAVEFKAHDVKKDPYDDRTDGTVDADAETRKHVRGQIINYAEHLFDYQHRTALFMLIVIGRRFRFSRWDRSGTLVTRAVDYVEQPHLLCEMLWYMSRLSNEALGFDSSAERIRPGSEYYRRMTLASFPVPTDIDHSERALTALPPDGAVFKYVRDMFRESLDPRWPYYRLEVPEKGRMRSFLVGKRVFRAPGMAGRGTRGYVALDIDASTDRFVWLKDAWRTHYELVDQEGSVLEKLNQADVTNVPTLICHGDILDQVTQTPEWWERKNPLSSPPPVPPFAAAPVASSSRTLVNPHPSSSKSLKRGISEVDNHEANPREDCPLRRHKHYRIVVKEIGLKLTEFQHGQQLLQIIFDCIYAHQEAAIGVKIMHRDISGGNILILPKALVDPEDGTFLMKWTGLLVDWELSKPIAQSGPLCRARQPERTGTWQFMSAAVLSQHRKVIEIPDELESFFHVILYYAIRYLRSNCPDVGAFIEDFFDTYTVVNGAYKCGLKKSTTMKGVAPLTVSTDGPELRFDSPLDAFLSKVLQWFKAHYTVQAYHRSQAVPSVSSNQSLASSTPQQPRPMGGFKPLGRGKYKLKTACGYHPTPFVTSKAQSLQKPSPQEEAEAAKLATHDAMLDALVDAMSVPTWPQDRVAGDNVPPSFEPKVPLGPPVGASISTVKRRRKAAQTSAKDPPRPSTFT